jgi:hypothetical protein
LLSGPKNRPNKGYIEHKFQLCRQQCMSLNFFCKQLWVLMLIFQINALADKCMCTDYTLSCSRSLQTTNDKNKACVYDENSGSKKASFRRRNQISSCQITGHLSWAPSEVTSHNEEHQENVGTVNTDFSAGHDSAHVSLNHNARKEII